MNGPVRHKCLSAIGKLMYFSPADMIQSLLSVTNISRYAAVILFLVCVTFLFHSSVRLLILSS